MYTDDELSDHSEDERMYEEFLEETDGGIIPAADQENPEEIEFFREDPPAEVIKGLFFGNWYHSDKPEHGFDVVISLGYPVTPEILYETEPDKYIYVDMGDTLHDDVEEILERVTESIHDALSAEMRVYVHCHLGQSRSTTVIIAYLIKYHGMTPKRALNVLRSKREAADPNNSFRRQLNAYWRKKKTN